MNARAVWMPTALLATGPAGAHTVGGPEAGGVLFDAVVLALVLGTAFVYGRGLARLWARAGPNRGVAAWEAMCFALALLVLAVALVGPLDGLAARSFSAHMTQHVLLMSVVAPALVLARPLAPLVAGLAALARLARGLRRSPLRHLAAGWPAFLVHGAVLWAWHAPGPYQAALTSEALHVLEHGSFLLGALLLWYAVLEPARRSAGPAGGLLWLLGTFIHSGMLGALITFAPAPLYAAYTHGPDPFGLSAVEDQQVAGLIMWVPGCAVYLLAALALLARWLQQAGAAALARPSQEPP